MRDYKNYHWKERMKVSFFLTSFAYGFDVSNPAEMDKNIFSKSKQS